MITAKKAIVDISSHFSDSTVTFYDRPQANTTEADSHVFSRSDINRGLENSLQSKETENAETRLDDEHLLKPISSDINSANLADNLTPESSASKLLEIESVPGSAQKNKSSIAVNRGDSIQAAIDDLAPGGIIEINSGIYNESLRIDKPLTIKGVDVGGGLPIIDARRRGNTVEISADEVILKGIVTTNSSNDIINQKGAGVLFCSSNNSTLEGIISYNNYRGIEFADSNNNSVSRSNISNNSYCGIELVDSNNNSISKSNVSYSDLGVRFFFSAGNTFKESYIKNTTNPLEFVSSSNNLVENNTFEDNDNNLSINAANKFAYNTVINIIKKDNNSSDKGVDLNTEEGGGTGVVATGTPSQEARRPSRGEWVPTPIYGDIYQDFVQEAEGTLVFNPPAVMVNGTGKLIDARISVENTSALVEGLLEKGDLKFRHINVKTNLTYVVKLECDSGFEIEAKRPDPQKLGEDPAVWIWYVTPTEAGNHTLILSVDLQLDNPPYTCQCINVTKWPVNVMVVEKSAQQRILSAFSSVYSSTNTIIAFLASVISLILAYRQLKKKKED